MRYPKLGAVKTRLAAEVGDQEALRVHTLLVRRTLGIAYDFKRLHPEVSIELVVEPPDSLDSLVRTFPGPWAVEGQTGKHLGERMGHALRRAFDRGGQEVVLVGTDIADLETRDLEAAFERVRAGTAVLGPARDGGFYLVGLGRFVEEPFRPSGWGTEIIFERTAGLLRVAGLQVESLNMRRDVDRPGDLQWAHQDPLCRERLSVIVPTLKAPALLQGWLQQLKDRLWPDDELIVVRGVDDRRLTAQDLDPHTGFMTAPRGRGSQLNHGVRQARGSLLLFLHDDTDLPDAFPYLIRKAAQRTGMALGCFQLSFSNPARELALIARWANLRSRLFRLPYGDQALFCRRTTFDRVGGFRHRYLMEDVAFVRACRAAGDLVMIDEAVVTSADRYVKKGVLRNSLQNHATLLFYRLGVREERLYEWYYRR